MFKPNVKYPLMFIIGLAGAIFIIQFVVSVLFWVILIAAIVAIPWLAIVLLLEKRKKR
jgi:hypothetical protein